MRWCISKSFCLMRLHTAGIVIAWTCGAWCLCKSILYGVLLSRSDFPEIFTQGLPIDQHDMQVINTTITAVVSLKLVMNILDLLASILLFIGTKKNSHLLLLPWLIENAITFVLKFLFFSICVAKGISFDLALFILIILGIHGSIWSAIYSLFHLIRSKKAIPYNSQTTDIGCEKVAPGGGYQLFSNADRFEPVKY